MSPRRAAIARWQLVSEFPLVNDDGQRLPNHSVKRAGPIDQLPGVVVAANPEGRTTLVEFYDLNCPYCRIASADVADMVAVDPDFVWCWCPPRARRCLDCSKPRRVRWRSCTPAQFYDFHRKIYSQRGTTDGLRALDVARGLGFDERSLTKLGDSDAITKIMKAHLAVGNSLGLAATPAFIIDGVAILGYPGRDGLQKIVDAARACGKVVC